jgi:hypothetical protein
MKSLYRFNQKNFSLLTALVGLLFLGGNCAYGQTERIPQGIVSALEKGDAGQLADHFNTTIDLNIPGHDAPCSKKQASQILKRFFENHPVKEFKSDHQGNSHDGSLYMIGTLQTTGDTSFRVYLLLKKRDGVNLIQQLQFDED